MSDISPARIAQDGFEGLCGFEIVELSEDKAHAMLPARKELADGAGALHPGALTALAQSLARRATAAALPAALAVETLANQTSFLRPLARGSAHARASRKHRGRRTWVWEVEVSDDCGELCALSRVTVALGEAPARRPDAEH